MVVLQVTFAGQTVCLWQHCWPVDITRTGPGLKGRTWGVMRGNALNVTGVRCGGFIALKIPRVCLSTVLVRLAQTEGSGQGGSRQTAAERGEGSSVITL
jgi:hypothetical protein